MAVFVEASTRCCSPSTVEALFSMVVFFVLRTLLEAACTFTMKARIPYAYSSVRETRRRES